MARHHADPGELKHRVDMYRLDQQPDGLGEMSTNHLFVASVWARVQPLSADRDEQGEQIMETVQHRITIRFRDDVASGWRLHLGGTGVRHSNGVRPDRSRPVSRVPVPGTGPLASPCPPSVLIAGPC